MIQRVKLIGSELALTTANTVGKAVVVRVYNGNAGAALITQANTGGTIGTVTIGAAQHEFIVKRPDDTLASNVAVQAVSVALT